MVEIVLGAGAVIMAFLALFVRMKSMKKPANARKILIPPVAMSTGFLMFLYEPARPTSLEVLEAIAVGLIFSIVLIKLSSFEIRENAVYMKKSKAFPFILLGLLAVRLIFKSVLGIHFEYEVLAGMFFILAFAMILPWRIAMYVKFRQVERELKSKQVNSKIPLNMQTENPAP
ncbi:cytochrome c biogenesis protein CcdC [Evansella sp. LMS18]|uniref:CcdC family protein n=1 Tax=Evansella sp. LMS18 TaxID=2924033 RepID=UPI0020D0F63E|nr:cytochrome c biogenesis protein CcdC [Evansella sp. LMS18]UTR10764.1 cytochrome c biogenesis protein CcdC [Evansella sp. LMS18]